MTSVKLKFKKRQGSAEGTLFFQIIHNREVRQVGTNIHIPSDCWDCKHEEIVRLSDAAVFGKKEMGIISDKIRCEHDRLCGIVKTLDGRHEDYTAADIVSLYRHLSSGGVTVGAFAMRLADRLDGLGRARTADCYRSAANRLCSFLGGGELTFGMMTAGLMERFEAYLRAEGLCRNTTSYYMRNLRSIYNKAVKEGLADKSSPFDSVYTGIDKTDKRAISWQDVWRLKHLDLTFDKSLELARDLFLFSFYTVGMPFVDIAYLRKKDLCDGHVTYYRRKTARSVTFKWRTEMQGIVDKYDTSATPYMLPIIEHADGTERRQYRNKLLLTNRKLKKVARLAGISQTLTMHVARHTWASIAKDKGIAVDDISRVLGHDSVKTTEIYLSTIRTSRADRINDLVIRGL